MNEKFEHLLVRAEQLIARIESILPQPLAQPDWSQAIAWRYRKRSSGQIIRLLFFRSSSFRVSPFTLPFSHHCTQTKLQSFIVARCPSLIFVTRWCLSLYLSLVFPAVSLKPLFAPPFRFTLEASSSYCDAPVLESFFH